MTADLATELRRIADRLDALEGARRPLLVSRRAAASMLSISLRHFEAKIEHEVETVRIGRRVLVVVVDLERIVRERAR